jgi:hypothetical protein
VDDVHVECRDGRALYHGREAAYQDEFNVRRQQALQKRGQLSAFCHRVQDASL